jgi:hypothetical protein
MGRTMEMGSVMLAGELAGSRTASGWRPGLARTRLAVRRRARPESDDDEARTAEQILRPSLESVTPDWGNDVNARDATDRPTCLTATSMSRARLRRCFCGLCASSLCVRAAPLAATGPGLVDASEPLRDAPGHR